MLERGVGTHQRTERLFWSLFQVNHSEAADEGGGDCALVRVHARIIYNFLIGQGPIFHLVGEVTNKTIEHGEIQWTKIIEEPLIDQLVVGTEEMVFKASARLCSEAREVEPILDELAILWLSRCHRNVLRWMTG